MIFSSKIPVGSHCKTHLKPVGSDLLKMETLNDLRSGNQPKTLGFSNPDIDRTAKDMKSFEQKKIREVKTELVWQENHNIGMIGLVRT